MSSLGLKASSTITFEDEFSKLSGDEPSLLKGPMAICGFTGSVDVPRTKRPILMNLEKNLFRYHHRSVLVVLVTTTLLEPASRAHQVRLPTPDGATSRLIKARILRWSDRTPFDSRLVKFV